MRQSIMASCVALLLGAGFASAQVRPDVDLAAIRDIAQEQMDQHELNALLLQVRIGGEVQLTLALGQAMTGVPVTADARFRNGAVALAYVAAVMLRLAEDGVIDLDAPVARWLPELPDSDTVTLRMLANMTSGYPDHVANEEAFVAPFLADPFAAWSPQALIDVSLSTPRLFAPGTNWDYSHTDYVILGQVLEAATGQPLHEVMARYVLTPLALTGTAGFDTAQIPAPVLHGFTAERGVWEDATFWNPSWTLPSGAIQVTTISDMARSFDGIVGHDGFLTPASRQQMIEPSLIGFGSPLPGCPTCHQMTESFSYGLGAMLQGDWVFQTPSFGGYAASVGTLPDEHAPQGRITIAAVVTHTAASFEDWSAATPNWADQTVRRIGELLSPRNPPPMR
ncbi:serine hydrolase domain-containing protein [Pararhodobacter zhoushanensis]|uniref:serine hydrolase domain-containing protein n=1 Tax=Pararhodobacter zhoushanensis TaxID=2479545 RepID=UPI000F8CAF24|nr:serine hydrolase domain-containing protein [Pararhodobacter zhoushanensis]